MKKIRLFLILSFFAVATIQAASQYNTTYTSKLRVVNLSEDVQWEDFTDFVHYIEDETGSLQARDAVHKLSEKEIEPKSFISSDLKAGKIYWIAFALKNDFQKSRMFAIDFGAQNTVLLFRTLLAQMDYPQLLPEIFWSSKEEPTSLRHIELRPSERAFFLARLEYKSDRPFKASVTTFSNVLNKEAGSIHLDGMIVGILLILAIYHVVIGSSLKEPMYYHYFLFLASCCLLVLTTYRTGTMPYLVPFAANWVHMSPLYPMLFAMITWSQFSKHYLEIPKLLPTLDKIINIAGSVMFFCVVMIWRGLTETAISIAAVCSVVLLAAIAYSNIWAFTKQSSSATYFAIANAPLVIAVFLLISKHFQHTPVTNFTYYSIQFAGLLQVCLISLGLGNRLSNLRREKEDALQSDLEHQKRAVEEHKELTKAYARFVPMEFFNLLDKENILDVQLGDSREHHMSVLFSDLKSYSTICEKLTSADSFRSLNEYLGAIAPIIRESNGFIDKYIGDAIMALFPNSADHAVTGAIAMILGLKTVNEQRARRKEQPLFIGIGIHTGRLILGTVGEKERMEGTVISDVVNIASRLETLTRIYNIPIIISEETVKNLKGTVFAYRLLGETKLKGKTEPTKFYEVFQVDEGETKIAKVKTKEMFEEAVNHLIQKNYTAAAPIFQEILQVNPTDAPAQYYYGECLRLLNQAAI